MVYCSYMMMKVGRSLLSLVLSLSRSIYLSVYLSIYLPTYLSISLSIYLFIYLSIYPFSYLCLSLPPMCLSFFLSLSRPFLLCTYICVVNRLSLSVLFYSPSHTQPGQDFMRIVDKIYEYESRKQ